ncbi:hypothetical protein [Acidocella aromatica]|uniref:Uncharacterized protein n=1 Tax=Acidocella aromatica TaxID=1303579 RepID=A0A840VIL3_9PROT|nr:hypothetical protein [Acidocella aromatica]MBB5373025.1 hypothetical protein [Acidocella aromatica]
MIFRKTTARPVAVSVAHTDAMAMLPPHRRIVATWRRDEATGRVRIVWKLLGSLEAPLVR